MASSPETRLIGRTADVQARAFRRMFGGLVLAAGDVVMNARAGAPIEGVRHKRVRADLVERLMDAYQESFGFYEPGEHPSQVRALKDKDANHAE